MKPKTVGCVSGQDPAARHFAAATGLLSDAIILTLDGELPVGFLTPGDRIITRDTGTAFLSDIVQRRVRCDLVTIAHGTLGHMRPDHDCLLPADQQVLLRDWRAKALRGRDQALVNARELVDGEFVTVQSGIEVTVHDLIFDDPHILYVDGLELASAAPRLAQARAA